MKKVAFALVSLFMAVNSNAGTLTGRDLVDFVEDDAKVALLVNDVIKDKQLHCNRPDLVSAVTNLGVLEVTIKFECNASNNINQTSRIRVSAAIAGDKLSVRSFGYKSLN